MHHQLSVRRTWNPSTDLIASHVSTAELDPSAAVGIMQLMRASNVSLQ